MSVTKEELAVTESPIDHGHIEDKAGDPDDSGVPSRYRGTEADKNDMMILGKKQVLRRNFKFVTMLGFASTVTASWEFLLPLFTFVLTDGGTGTLFWGFIAATIGMTLVYASLSEMASMCPTAGVPLGLGVCATQNSKLLSYIVGWLCAVGWQVYLAGVCFMVGSMIQGLIALNVPDYVWHNWHGTLLSIAVIGFAVIFNTVLAARLPLIEGIVLILHLAGIFVIIIPLWVMAPRAHPHVLVEFTNYGGWSSLGLSAMIGLTTPMSVLVGYDCSVHMSEEIQDASLTLPKAIMSAIGSNALLGFIMAITLIFTMGDIDSMLVFYNATQSYAGTNTMTACVIILLCSCCVSEVATASRQCRPGWNIPLRAVCVSVLVSSLLACINLGSSTALNAINSLGGVSILGSYFVTISCLVHRRLFGDPLPPRRWSLGKFGLAINIASLCYLAPVWFFAFWPLVTPVTAITMNWSSTMFGGVIGFALIYYYFRARHQYTGPVLLVKRE